MLSSLEIKNFRTFSHLVIERLGRVNLIVGKNNVGKTTLLEALRLYASLWAPQTIASILHERNEVVAAGKQTTLLDLQCMFHGCVADEGDEIRIRECVSSGNPVGFVATALPEVELDSEYQDIETVLVPKVSFALEIRHDDRTYTFQADRSLSYTVASGAPKPPAFDLEPPFLRGIASSPSLEETISRWWDSCVLTSAEARVLGAVKIFAPIKGASYVVDPRTDRARFCKVSVAGMSRPRPLAALGDGTVRMFQLAVAMEYAAIRGRMVDDPETDSHNVFPLLLIDEVETGIHHSLHADLWRFVFKAARLLDVQVFATTHSQDCLRGFAEAVAEDEEADGQVIRLERDADEEATRAIVISREKLPIVVRDSIEVR